MSDLRVYYQRYYGKFLSESKAREVDSVVRLLVEKGPCTPRRIFNDLGFDLKELRDLAARNIIQKEQDGRVVTYRALDHGFPGGTDPICFWPSDFQVVMANLRAKGSMTPPELRALGPCMLSAAQKMASVNVIDYDRGVYSVPEVLG